MKITAALGEIVYSISCRELITDGYLCDAEIKVIENMSYPEIEYWDNYQDIIQKCIVENEYRNKKIVELALE